MDNPDVEENVHNDIEEIKEKLLEIEQKLNQLLDKSKFENTQQINNSIGLLKKAYEMLYNLCH